MGSRASATLGYGFVLNEDQIYAIEKDLAIDLEEYIYCNFDTYIECYLNGTDDYSSKMLIALKGYVHEVDWSDIIEVDYKLPKYVGHLDEVIQDLNLVYTDHKYSYYLLSRFF